MNLIKKKILKFFLYVLIFLFHSLNLKAEEEKLDGGIADQIQVLTKDLKTLEKAVYQKSDITSLSFLLQFKRS